MESLNSHFWFHPHNNNNNNGLLRRRMNLLSPSCWSVATQVIEPAAAAAAVEIRGVTESVFLLVKEELYWCGHHSSSSSNSIPLRFECVIPSRVNQSVLSLSRVIKTSSSYNQLSMSNYYNFNVSASKQLTRIAPSSPWQCDWQLVL